MNDLGGDFLITWTIALDVKSSELLQEFRYELVSVVDVSISSAETFNAISGSGRSEISIRSGFATEFPDDVVIPWYFHKPMLSKLSFEPFMNNEERSHLNSNWVYQNHAAGGTETRNMDDERKPITEWISRQSYYSNHWEVLNTKEEIAEKGTHISTGILPHLKRFFENTFHNPFTLTHLEVYLGHIWLLIQRVK